MKKLPDYAPMLLAFHREFACELKAMVEQLPIVEGMRALEVATGDGQFAIWLKERVGKTGSVTATDISQTWLKTAEENVKQQKTRSSDQPQLKQADATELPYEDGTFDFVWCAQSLYSLSHMHECVAEMKRVLRPGGILAIMENDSLHHVLFPWPVALELRIHTAEFRSFQKQAKQPGRFYVGRWLSRLFQAHGLQDAQERSFSYTRQFPLTDDAEIYFSEYLQALRERVKPFLTNAALARLDALRDPHDDRCFWKQPDFSVVCLDRVAWAHRP